MTISIQTGITNNQYACYRSKTNFKNPDIYVPERWLDDPDYVSDQRQVFQPFSYGARNCIGKRQVTPTMFVHPVRAMLET